MEGRLHGSAFRSDVHLTTEFQLVRATFGWLGRANMPVYKGNPPPGAYIRELAQLRERDAALDSVEDELRRQREEVARLREELVRKGEADGE